MGVWRGSAALRAVAFAIVLAGVTSDGRAAGFAGYADLTVSAEVTVDPVYHPPAAGAGNIAGSDLRITAGGIDTVIGFDPASSLSINLISVGDGLSVTASALSAVAAYQSFPGVPNATAGLFADGVLFFQNGSRSTIYSLTLTVDRSVSVAVSGSANPQENYGAYASGLVRFGGLTPNADIDCGLAACEADNLGLNLPPSAGGSALGTFLLTILPASTLTVRGRIEADTVAFAEFLTQGASADSRAAFTISGVQTTALVPLPAAWMLFLPAAAALAAMGRNRRV